MKILHLVPYYPPGRVGGVGDFVAGLHRGLVELGHTSTVVTTGRSSPQQPGVHRIARRPAVWFLKTVQWAWRARDYDIVHCQGGESLPAQIALLCLLRRPKILVTFHASFVGIRAAFRPYQLEGSTFARGWRSWKYRNVVSRAHLMLDWCAVRLADEVNAISHQLAREIAASGGGREIEVVHCGIPDVSVADPHEGTEPIDLLYVGSPGHRKRVLALPYVLRAVRRSHPEARLRIVGFLPEDEPALIDLLTALGLRDEVDFAGVKTAAQLPAYYASAKVLVVPSAYEGLPLVILEALRAGLPVVATRVSGHPEAIEDGANGFLVELDEPVALARACCRLLADPSLQQEMGRRARQVYEQRFGYDRQIQQYLDLYRRLLVAET